MVSIQEFLRRIASSEKHPRFFELINESGGISHTSTSFQEINYLYSRKCLPLSELVFNHAKIRFTAEGDEAGANKGIMVKDITNNRTIGWVYWTGLGIQHEIELLRSYTNQGNDPTIVVEGKCSSGTETVKFYNVSMELY